MKEFLYRCNSFTNCPKFTRIKKAARLFSIKFLIFKGEKCLIADKLKISARKKVTPSNYIHGTGPEEQRRLSMLNQILNDACFQELNLTGGEKILDVGCGLSQLTRKMARAVAAKGFVLGIERDEKQIAEAKRQARFDGEEDLFEIRAGDALDLPLKTDEWERFDVAHARFILEHISDPLTVIKQMIQSVRPGGRIVLAVGNHDTMRLFPEPDYFYELWSAYIRSFEFLGNDPYIGHKLVFLLHRAGAAPVRNNWIFFGSCAGDANFKLYVENLIGVIKSARQVIIGEKLLDENEFEKGIEAVNSWQMLPDAAMWFSLSWAEGRKINV